MDTLTTPPPQAATYEVLVPRARVLLVKLARPKQHNAIHSQGHWDLHRLFDWFEAEPSLQVAVVTGSGDKAFCTGQDLIEWGKDHASKPVSEQPAHPPTGFAGLSQRAGKKIVIAAVNGYCFGGGVEIILNCDMIVASPRAIFSLPEASRGLYVAAGGLARLASIAGMPIATELALTGRRFTPEEAVRWGIVNRISSSADALLPEALQLAGQVADLSPDALIVTKAGLRGYWEDANVREATRKLQEQYHAKILGGQNLREGLAAFREKRKPRWLKPSL
ncbi:hypothetical protein KEM52_005514 [Ascosphaera acerosa]|nr:hypothetical protein KEM52_005514 [Ascosphaera acerosa]